MLFLCRPREGLFIPGKKDATGDFPMAPCAMKRTDYAACGRATIALPTDLRPCAAKRRDTPAEAKLSPSAFAFVLVNL